MSINFTPITDALSEEYVYVDNEMQDAIREVGLFQKLLRQGCQATIRNCHEADDMNKT